MGRTAYGDSLTFMSAFRRDEGMAPYGGGKRRAARGPRAWSVGGREGGAVAAASPTGPQATAASYGARGRAGGAGRGGERAGGHTGMGRPWGHRSSRRGVRLEHRRDAG